MGRFDPRLVIGVGFVLFAASNFMNVHITADTAADQLLLPNIVRAFGQALVFAPLSAVATAGLQTFLSKREQFHSNILTSAVSGFSEATRTRIDQLTSYFLAHGASDPATAAHKAIVAVAARVRQQANVMAFGDTFALLGTALVMALVATLLLRKPAPGQAFGAAH